MKSPDIEEKLDEDQGHRLSMTPSLRPMFCNVCGESLQRIQLGRVTLHGLACEVCKVRLHKECLKRASICCKWTTLTSMGKSVMEDEDGNLQMPHQWMSGNFTVNSKCVVCQKPCGSILRIQDFFCLWCQATVHTGCKKHTNTCDMGAARLSILPPTHVNMCDDGGFWRASKPPKSSPLLVFVNTKSGDHQGVKMLRKFKQLLNPVQVFDLTQGGTFRGLKLFQDLESFRVLVCGGDGSVGWVLDGIDRLGLHKQCQVGILPLGTGNDLSRVMGWGGSYDDDSLLPHVLERLESAQIQMFDRWSISSYEATSLQNRIIPLEPIVAIEDSAADHLSRIIYSQSHNVIITSAMVLCGIVQELVSKVVTSLEVHKGEEEYGVEEKKYENKEVVECETGKNKNKNDVDNHNINAFKIEKMKPETGFHKNGRKINRVNSKKIISKKRIKVKKRKNKSLGITNANNNYHTHNGNDGKWQLEEIIKGDKKTDEINKNKYIKKKRNANFKKPVLQSTEYKNRKTISSDTANRTNTKTRKYSEDSLAEKCVVLKDKMEALLQTLASESAQLGDEEEEDDDVVFVEGKCSKECEFTCYDASKTMPEKNNVEKQKRCNKGGENERQRTAVCKDTRKSSCHSKCLPKTCTLNSLRSRTQLMHRANSLKKAIRHIVKLTEEAVDEQNRQTMSFNAKTYNSNNNNNKNNKHVNNKKHIITKDNRHNNNLNDINGLFNVIKTPTQSPTHSNLLTTKKASLHNNGTTSYLPVEPTTNGLNADNKVITTTLAAICCPLSKATSIGTKPSNSSTHATSCIDSIHDIATANPNQTTPHPSLLSYMIQHVARQLEYLHKEPTIHLEKHTNSMKNALKINKNTFETTYTDTKTNLSLATSFHLDQKTPNSTIAFDYKLCQLTSILQPDSTHSPSPPTNNSTCISPQNNFSTNNQTLRQEFSKKVTHACTELFTNLPYTSSTYLSANEMVSTIKPPLPTKLPLCTRKSPLPTKKPLPSTKIPTFSTKKSPPSTKDSPSSPTKPPSPKILPPSSCAPHMIIPSEIFIFPVSPELEDKGFSDAAEQTDSSDESSNSSSPHNTPSLLSPFNYHHSHHHHHDQPFSPQQPSSPSYHHYLVPLSPSTDAQTSPQQQTPPSLLTPSHHYLFYPPNPISHHYHHPCHHRYRHSLSPSPISPPRVPSSQKRPSSSSSSSHHQLDLFGRWSPIFGMPSLPQVTSPRLSPAFFQRKNNDGDDEEDDDIVNNIEVTRLAQTKDNDQGTTTAAASNDPIATVATIAASKKGRRISSLSKLQQNSAICCPSLQASSTTKHQNVSKQSRHLDFPILNLPLLQSLPKQSYRKQKQPSTNQSSLISRMLLANADAICAPISPFNDLENVSRDDFTEKCVMNNYFGIGLDAKIALDFHNKRQGHPSKCSSRTKNIMWYGVLGGKEVLQRTHKKLDQKVRLECDGKLIPLPNLQGIVVLNIPSYMGGINFWGGYKENDGFLRPSLDDRVLEVVAVFGSMQLGISRVINLHKHRIAQCRSVRISIIGEESLPVQVDGEAWMQKPGIIWISHKNRAQLLTRDRSFEEVLKSWKKTEKKEKLNLCAVKDWSQKDIECWLSSMQLEQYIEHFKRHDVKGEELLNLKRCDIKELGISKVGHVKRLMKEIKILKSLSKRCIDLSHKQISSPK